MIASISSAVNITFSRMLRYKPPRHSFEPDHFVVAPTTWDVRLVIIRSFLSLWPWSSKSTLVYSTAQINIVPQAPFLENSARDAVIWGSLNNHYLSSALLCSLLVRQWVIFSSNFNFSESLKIQWCVGIQKSWWVTPTWKPWHASGKEGDLAKFSSLYRPQLLHSIFWEKGHSFWNSKPKCWSTVRLLDCSELHTAWYWCKGQR